MYQRQSHPSSLATRDPEIELCQPLSASQGSTKTSALGKIGRQRSPRMHVSGTPCDTVSTACLTQKPLQHLHTASLSPLRFRLTGSCATSQSFMSRMLHRVYLVKLTCAYDQQRADVHGLRRTLCPARLNNNLPSLNFVSPPLLRLPIQTRIPKLPCFVERGPPIAEPPLAVRLALLSLTFLESIAQYE